MGAGRYRAIGAGVPAFLVGAALMLAPMPDNAASVRSGDAVQTTGKKPVTPFSATRSLKSIVAAGSPANGSHGPMPWIWRSMNPGEIVFPLKR